MNIHDIIKSIYKLPLASLETLTRSVSEVGYPKCFHLFRENRKEAKSYFIKEGIVRAYANKKEKEVTFGSVKKGMRYSLYKLSLRVWKNMQV